VREADRERYARELGLLRAKLAEAVSSEGAPSPAIDDDAVWAVYAGVEKLVAVLKFRLDYETPGVFTELPDAKAPAGLLAEAQGLLSRSEAQLLDSELVDAVGTLRRARNDLRSYLTAKRKAATSRAKTTKPA
jgi:hypothetical protein